MLPRDVNINKAIAARKDLCRSHRGMLAAGAFEDLLVVGPETDDMLLGRQAFLHRRVDVIALSGALAPVERRQHSRRGE